ncbi:uncharacterized protein LOC117647867 [Thrips palmi]|uniref:Uncharacterized protein LOC117647867 n=1 Tax=Thrips palmi TaxID=161013 RepID=A0A6P8ZQE8_THRPL|nr:uncharacterized protein LOC117647867 [Thrips palmi]
MNRNLFPDNSDSDSDPSHDSNDEDFTDIAMYFDVEKFDQLSKLEKSAFMAQKARYDQMRNRCPDLPIQPPNFMTEYSNRILKRKQAADKSAKKKARVEKQKDISSQPKRTSGRIRQAAAANSTTIDASTAGADATDIDEVDDDLDFEVKIYFTPSEWSGMALTVKRHAQNALEDYNNAKSKGIDMAIPKFMNRGNKEAAGSSGSHAQDATDVLKSQSSELYKGSEAPSSSGSNSTLPGFLHTSKDKLPIFNIDLPGCSLWSSSGSNKSSPFRGKSTSFNSVNSQIIRKPMTKDQNSFVLNSNIANNDMQDDIISITEPENTDETDQLVIDENLDVKAAIGTAIKKVVPKIQDSVLATLESTLELKGVESVDDFTLIDASWLQGHGLTEIQVKKIMVAFQNYGSDKENIGGKEQQKKAQKKKPPLPLMKPVVEQPTIASRHSLSTKVIEVGVLDLRIDFNKFSESLLSSMGKQERPSACDRLRMVNLLSHDIYDRYNEVKKSNPSLQKTPGRDVYKKVVQALFVDYKACFNDTLNSVQYKDGSWSLVNQIETCVENMYRPNTPRGERQTPAKGNRSAACILPEKYSIAMTKQMQGEAEATRKNLLSIFRSPRDKWDWPAIKEMMKHEPSLGAQRALINSRTRDITFITEKWPFLSELSGLMCHLDEITGQSLLESFENFVDNSMDDLISYLIAMSPQRVKLMRLKKELDFGSGEHRRLLAALFMLAIHWNEDVSTLASLVEENTMPHEVEDVIKLPSTPHIVALGTSFYTTKKFFVFLDCKCLCSNLNNALEALMCMCAAYFIFGVLYPTSLNNTLTYFERMVANLSDGTGLVKSTTARGAPALSSFSKVKKLQDEIERFQKDLLGDD